MKVNGNALKVGNVIEHKKRLWIVTKTQHTQPGKGGAYLQAELKDIRNGTKLNERFRASETVERARLDEQALQFLYQEGDLFTFMDNETYEQISLPQSLIGESSTFLQDGMIVTLLSYEEDPIMIKLPEQITVEVTEADAVVKGQTASSSYKPAVITNGHRVLVPPHIEAGTKIIINTEDGSYVERAKE